MFRALLPFLSYPFVDCAGKTFIFTITIKVLVFLHALFTSVLSGGDWSVKWGAFGLTHKGPTFAVEVAIDRFSRTVGK
jgi:hypothetical protein